MNDKDFIIAFLQRQVNLLTAKKLQLEEQRVRLEREHAYLTKLAAKKERKCKIDKQAGHSRVIVDADKVDETEVARASGS